MPKTFDRYDLQHLRNLGAYGREIEAIYRSAEREAAAIGASLGNVNPGRPFSFADYPRTKARIDELMARMHGEVQVVILNGIDAEWTLSNNKNSELARRVFGSAMGRMTPEQERQYFTSNEPAREAFKARKTAGLNLSDRVWRYTDQFKEEIEMGLDLGLRDGLSAAEIARDLRKYLQQPDKLFRRVRDEHGNLHLSSKAAAYHPGAGVYRSSQKNAVRLARTEVNMAYRTADYERWKSLDFVVGIRVMLSNNHTLNGRPFVDICDDLKGDYPKTFKFTGWHPACRCFAVPILKTEDELAADTDRILAGEQTNTDSANSVTELPGNFKGWIIANKGRIEAAERRGTLPYFLSQNKQSFKSVVRSLSILDRAAARHAARTPQQIESIRGEWYERKSIRHYGQNMLRYMSGISDVDTAALSSAMTSGDVSLILSEARKLRTVGKRILSLSRLDNPMQIAREFSMAQAEMVNAAVENKITGWAHLSLEEQKKKLLFEVQWVADNKKYPTWEFAQRAYQKELAAVVDKIDWEQIADGYGELSGFKTKSAVYKALVSKLQVAIKAKDKSGAQSLLSELKIKRDALEKQAAKRNVKKVLSGESLHSFTDDAYLQSRKDGAIWCKDTSESMSKFKRKADEVYGSASEAETQAAMRYTSGSGYVNRPLRGYAGSWGNQNFKGIGNVPLDYESARAPKDIEALTKLIDKSSYEKDIWLQRGIETDGLQGFLQISDLDERGFNALVGKTLTDTGFMSCGAAKGTGFGGNILNIYCPRGTKMLYIDGRSAYASENEMLIQRNTRFRVTKVEKKGSRYYIDIEVIGQI